MTKLEQKLIELGYECKGGTKPNGIIYRKKVTEWLFIDILTDIKRKKIVYHKTIQCVRHPIDHTQAFNQLQSDLEVLKKCEND